MRTNLMVSATHEGRKMWFNEWSGINRCAIHDHKYAHMKTTMRNGDVYLWVTLSPALLSMRVDAIHFDDRCSGRLSEEQEELLRILPTKVNPGPVLV